MPYVKVPVEELVVGQEYALTHVGCESRMGKEAKYTYGDNPDKYTKDYRPKIVVPECVRLEDIPPTSQGALEKAYKTWVGIRAEIPGAVPYSWSYKPKKRGADVSRVGSESEYRKRAFYAGVNAAGAHIFTQERAFGSRKPVAFEPIDTMATKNGVPLYKQEFTVGAGGDWVVWKEAGGSNVNVTRKNNNAGAASPAVANVPTGNLLGLNNKPKMTNANANTKKARENWYKQHTQEQELAPLFPSKGGAKTRKSRRSRTY